MKRTPITQEVRQELRTLKREAGRDAMARLVRDAKPPAGFNAALVKGWITGRITAARPDHLAYVREAWRPTGPRVAVTPQIKDALTAHKARIGHSWSAITRVIAPPPNSLTAATIASWTNGAVATARQEHLNFVLERLAHLPGKDDAGSSPFHVCRTALTAAIRSELRHHQRRTGWSVARVLREHALPPGVTTAMVSSWTGGRVKTAPSEALSAILAVLRSLPDATPKRVREPTIPRTALTDAIRDELQHHRKRTGQPFVRVLREHSLPPAVRASAVSSWITGRVKTAPSEALSAVLAVLRSLPDATPKRVREPTTPRTALPDAPPKTVREPDPARAALTPKLIAELNALKRQSGVGPVALLSKARGRPPGLTANLVHQWLRGGCQTVRKDYLSYVLDAWRAIPRRTRISPAILERLKSERERTGTGPGLLLRYAENAPGDLMPGMIAYWLSGATKTALESHLDFVLTAYSALPDRRRPKRERDAPPQVALTKERVEHLRTLRAETGIGPQALFSGVRDAPDGLNSNTVRTWLDGKAEHVRKDHYDYVIARWRSLPARMTLTPDLRSKLEAERTRTGVGWQGLIAQLGDCPDDLSPATLSGWAIGRVATIRSDLWTLVLDAYASLPDASTTAPGQKQPYLGGTQRGDRRPFAEADRAALIAERERTGVGQTELLQIVKAGQPERLTATNISGWINNPPLTILTDRYDWVLKAWRSLPDQRIEE